MADEKEVVKDQVTVSTPETTTDSSATTPVGEKPTAKTTVEAVPYDRFQEVIKQKNAEKVLREQYEARIKELETRLPSGVPAAQDKIVQRLVAGGMKEDAAKLIAEAQREAQREAMAPYEAKENARAVQSWAKELERSDPDYKKLAPELAKAFDALSDEDKRLAVSSPKGLEWFYKSVKSEVLGAEVSKAREAGVKQGYESKSLKEGMSGTPKSSTATEEPLTFESIRAGALKKMSDAEYIKRKPEIDAIVAKGPTRK